LFWQKEAKTNGRNNHPADSLYRRLCKGGKACGRDASPNKGKKAKQARGSVLPAILFKSAINVLRYFLRRGIAYLPRLLATFPGSTLLCLRAFLFTSRDRHPSRSNQQVA
jgi:hypothetical protein